MVHRRTGDFTMLTQAPHRALAEPIVELLKDHGINAWIQSDDCGGVDPALNFTNGTHVMVPTESVEQSRQLLQEFRDANPLTH